MASSATNFSRNGVSDWIIQRVSAVILAVYTLVLFGFFIAADEVTYEVWNAFIQCAWMEVFTVLAVLALTAHAWVGVWTILTDYIKPFVLRVLLQVGMALALLAYLLWTILILWGL